MSALTTAISREGDRDEVSVARLRLSQVALIGAMDANRELLLDERWQNALAAVNGMISEAQAAEAQDLKQLVLFPRNHRGTEAQRSARG